jgi:voltage-gated potassium channel
VTERREHYGSAAPSERGELQQRISAWLDLPLTVLALIMLGLLVVEFTVDLGPTWGGRVAQAQLAIWIVFVATFFLELTLAPSKLEYLRRNWLTAISVALPALRTLRLLRMAHALRGISLVRTVTTLNRGTRALEHIVRKGQFGYVLLLTLAVTVTAAAGAYYFERDMPGAAIQTPGEAIWWAATMITTISSPLETVTLEGRILALLLRVFALGISGYLTASIAVYLLGDTRREDSTDLELRRLRLELLRMQRLLERSLPQREPDADDLPAPRRTRR